MTVTAKPKAAKPAEAASKKSASSSTAAKRRELLQTLQGLNEDLRELSLNAGRMLDRMHTLNAK